MDIGHNWILDTDRRPVRCDDIQRVWAFHENIEGRRVGLTEIDETCDVSTVFSRYNESLDDNDPICFETLVRGGPHDDYRRHYRTWEEAERGHAEIVAILRAGGDPNEEK